MGADGPEHELDALWGEVADLGYAEELLGWDQQTQMPERGVAGRAHLLGTLAGLKHERLSSPRMLEAVMAAAEAAEPGSVLEAQAREARRQVERAVRVPERLAREKASAASAGHAAWREARAKTDFALFRDPLERLVRLAREEAACLAKDGSRYDALMDEYEPGAKEAELAPLFARLRERLSATLRAVVESGRTVDVSVVRGDYPAERQLAFGRRVAEAIGFDFRAGRIDTAAHPFCTGFGTGDVRFTWRSMPDDFRPALYGILHEAGHGLYEQGLPEEWARTPIGPFVSLGVHESQSRLWENLVGRSRAFWEWALPLFHEHFPKMRNVTADALWPALRTVAPSLIRVEADEGTYDLHVAIRFELERALIGGALEVDDLPAAWDDAYEDALGIRPPNAALGVLQDVHWSEGMFGYFPTYTLGNLMMAQLYRAAERDLGALEPRIAAGDFGPLLAWLRDEVHRHGSRYPAAELVERATGAPLSADAYLALRADAVEAVYGVRA